MKIKRSIKVKDGSVAGLAKKILKKGFNQVVVSNEEIEMTFTFSSDEGDPEPKIKKPTTLPESEEEDEPTVEEVKATAEAEAAQDEEPDDENEPEDDDREYCEPCKRKGKCNLLPYSPECKRRRKKS